MQYTSIATAIAAFALAGCATQVHFESDPPGAKVTYVSKHQVLGTAPLDTSVHDDFGWFSVYRFTAEMDGYEPAIIEFKERTPLDAQLVVPSVVKFELKKKALAQPKSGSVAPTAAP